MLKEFKAFALKGNVVDMAVGVVIGTAFGKIVTSLVNDIVMPPIGLLIGNIDFSRLHWTLANSGVDGKPVTLNYGAFINNIIDFFIVSVSIFLVIQFLHRWKKPGPAPEITTKECPQCTSVIPLKAHRCPFCTSQL